MVGPYSVNQMDDFYDALARGQVKPTGIMNYVQRLIIAGRCGPNARVVDVCCGRGLQLPVLYQARTTIGSYTGLDISPVNLEQARDCVVRLNRDHGGAPFDLEWIECDVAQPWPDRPPYDLALYTSALEHLPRQLGEASLRHTAGALEHGGVLMLSTPNTPGSALQHRVHVYEWSTAELLPVLDKAGLEVERQIGILPPEHGDLVAALTEQYGTGAAAWYRDLRAFGSGADAFVDVVTAVASASVASEVLYVCRRR
jgi:SAM-dependent methyltransferase